MVWEPINGVINALNQKEKLQPNVSFNWNEFFKAFSKSAFLGGAGGLVVGAVRDHEINDRSSNLRWRNSRLYKKCIRK